MKNRIYKLYDFIRKSLRTINLKKYSFGPKSYILTSKSDFS